MDQEKNSKKVLLNVTLIILGGIVIIGCFFLGKIVGSNSVSTTKNITDNIIDNNPIKKGETNLTDSKVLIKKLEEEFLIPNNIIELLNNGKTDEFSDFAKIYITLYNIIYNSETTYLCDKSKVDVCIDESLVINTSKKIFGTNTKISHNNYKEFKTYPFDEINNSIAVYNSNIYKIKNLFTGHGVSDTDGYIKVPYRLTKKENIYSLSYYLIYLDTDDNNCDMCEDITNNIYTYYTNKDKKEKIFVLKGEENNDFEERILNSSIKKEFKKITLIFEETEEKITFIEYKITN